MNKAFNNIKRGLSIINCQLFIVLLLGLLACSNEVEMPDEPSKGGMLRVPIAFNLQNVGDGLTTKVSPEDGVSHGNDVRPVKVDKVKVYVYSRPTGGNYHGDNATGFTRTSREYTFAVVDKGEDEWPRYEAEGWVEMSGDKEYRMTAIAYNSEEVAEKPFTVTGNSFEEAAIQLGEITNEYDENAKEYNTPEFFFGTVLAHERDTLFTYDDVKNQENSLSGWLYRGVAGIQLSLFNVPEDVAKIELLADTIYTKVGACYYDDFLYAYAPEKEDAYKRFTLGGTTDRLNDVDLERGEGEVDGVFQIIGPNLLTDICTSLSVRVTMKDNTTKFARLRLKETGSTPGVPVTKAAPGGGPGTGIVEDVEIPEDPENPGGDDPGAPFRVCFKRNNYYQIVGDYSKLLTQEYTLRVVVNPNWDYSVELSLEKQ